MVFRQWEIFQYLFYFSDWLLMIVVYSILYIYYIIVCSLSKGLYKFKYIYCTILNDIFLHGYDDDNDDDEGMGGYYLCVCMSKTVKRSIIIKILSSNNTLHDTDYRWDSKYVGFKFHRLFGKHILLFKYFEWKKTLDKWRFSVKIKFFSYRENNGKYIYFVCISHK